jgi:hypothetical protein
MTPAEYWDKLNAHDWYYAFSDDHRVWERGSRAINELNRLADNIKGGRELLKAFHKHMFSGKAWGTEKSPKPERPSE